MGCVYILRLESDCFYVGYTENLEQRIRSHKIGNNSCAWVDLNPFACVMFVKHNVPKAWERYATLKMMEKYGWENVRGSGWTKVNLNNPPAALSKPILEPKY